MPAQNFHTNTVETLKIPVIYLPWKETEIWVEIGLRATIFAARSAKLPWSRSAVGMSTSLERYWMSVSPSIRSKLICYCIGGK